VAHAADRVLNQRAAETSAEFVRSRRVLDRVGGTVNLVHNFTVRVSASTRNHATRTHALVSDEAAVRIDVQVDWGGQHEKPVS